MSSETIVLQTGHVDIGPQQITLSLSNCLVDVQYQRTTEGKRLTSVRIEVSQPDLKAISEALGLEIRAESLESLASDGIVSYAAVSEQGRLFMAGMHHAR